MAKRTRAFRNRHRTNVKPKFWLLVFLLTIIILIAIFYKFYQSFDRFDDRTGCILDKPHTKHTVFLVDRSDDFSERQVKDLREVLVRTFQELEINELFSIYAIGGNVPSIPTPLRQFCRPAQETNEGNTLSVQSFLEKRYNRIFEINVDPILDDLTMPLPSEESPLLEWIVAISEAPDFASRALSDRRMVIFSDMVQYVPQEGFVFCSTFPDFNRFRQDRYYARIATDLSGSRVTVYNVRRANGSGCTVAAQRNMRALEDFWFAYFDDAGARMSPRRFIRIGE